MLRNARHDTASTQEKAAWRDDQLRVRSGDPVGNTFWAVGSVQVFTTGLEGHGMATVDLTAVTSSLAAPPGETWYFQAWFRDNVGGQPTSNFMALLTFLGVTEAADEARFRRSRGIASQ